MGLPTAASHDPAMIISSQDDRNARISVSLEQNDNFNLLSNMPGFKKWVGRDMIFRPTGANITYINRHWPQAEWRGAANHWLDEFIAAQHSAEATKVAKQSQLLDDSGYKYKREPMDHQRRAFALTRDHKYFGLFCEQGTGKTKIILDNAAYLYSRGEIDTLIVVAWPNGVHRNWIEVELPEDMPEWCPVQSAFYSSNLTKTKLRELEAVVTARDKLRVVAFSVESFASQNAQAWLLRFLSEGRAMLVIDQSASIKNPQAGRTKFLCKKAAPLAAYRRILDGAPAAENASELYSQFLFLDAGILGHDTWTSFRNEFCEIGWFNEIKGYKNQDRLKSLIDGWSFRVLEKDCLDLSERIYKRWMFPLAPEEMRVYEELRTTSMAELNEETLRTTLPIVCNLRMQQVASGWFPLKEPKMIGAEPARLTALKALLQECTGGKVIIYSRFRRDIQLIKATLGEAALTYYGGDSEDARAKARVRFQEDADIRVLIGQPRALGIGLTLTAAEYVVFYANDPSLRLREEAEKRAHRKGQEKHLKVIDLVAEDTLDLKYLRMFKAKKDVAEVIMADPKSFFLDVR